MMKCRIFIILALCGSLYGGDYQLDLDRIYRKWKAQARVEVKRSNLHIVKAGVYYRTAFQQEERRMEDYSRGHYSPSLYEQELQAAQAGLE